MLVDFSNHTESYPMEMVECNLFCDVDDDEEMVLKMHNSDVLTNMETKIDLFETLLCSHSSRPRVVKNANGHHIDY